MKKTLALAGDATTTSRRSAAGARRFASAIVLSIGLAACPAGDGGDPPRAPEVPIAKGAEGEGPLVTCGSIAYPAGLLARESAAETENDPAAIALHETVKDFNEDERSGWIRLGEVGDRVIFAHPLEGGDVREIEVETSGGNAKVVRYGGCRPNLHIPGHEVLNVALDPDHPPRSDEVAVALEVHERTCNGGPSLRGRILQPDVKVTDDAFEVTVIARRGSPPKGECQAAAQLVPLTVPLGMPIGSRAIRDAGTHPPNQLLAPGAAVAP